ncbi:MAG: transposase [Thermoguttaceae bacterium]
MPDYRRWYVPGGTFFFTLTTHHRRPILATDSARRCLREAVDKVRIKWPLELVAIVLLPDHLHTVWTLPPETTATRSAGSESRRSSRGDTWRWAARRSRPASPGCGTRNGAFGSGATGNTRYATKRT